MRQAVRGAFLAVTMMAACSIHQVRPPPSTTLIVTVVDARSGEALPGARVSVSPGNRSAVANEDGRAAFDVPAGSLSYSVAHDQYTSFDGSIVHVSKQTELIAPLERRGPRHPDPVVGRIRVLDGTCLADAVGCRTFVVLHYGNMAALWGSGQRELVLRDLHAAAEAGYTVVRTWWHFGRPSNFEPTIDYRDPNFVPNGIALANAAAERGLRVAIGSGAVAGLSAREEEDMARAFRAIIDGAGPDKFAWTEPVNEPSSIHATSDDDGDNTPEALRRLSRIMSDGTGMLWHLGYGSNVAWGTEERFDQWRYTPPDQPVGYYHGYRGGRVRDKIHLRFSWLYGEPGRQMRLWIDGEGVGAPACANSLNCVSATAYGAEMDDPEALALIVAMQSLRGLGSNHSGNGVQRYQEWAQVVGWHEIPWTVAQLPRDVHTFQTIHHSGDRFRQVRMIEASDDVRIDGAIDDDGRFAYVIYGPRGSYRLRAARSFTGRLCDPSTMTCADVSVDGGGELPVSFEYGRLLVGRMR